MIICPFGIHLQKYWDSRYELFSKFDSGIQVDAESLYSITPEKLAHFHAQKVKDLVILDGFGGVGGNSIAFAKYCKKVYHVEVNVKRLDMAKNNAKIYDIYDKIEFINADFFDALHNIKADVVYLDPPWGGPGYSNLTEFLLSDFYPDGREILNHSLKYYHKIMMRVPKNFCFDELNCYGINFKVVEDFLNNRVISKTFYMGLV